MAHAAVSLTALCLICQSCSPAATASVSLPLSSSSSSHSALSITSEPLERLISRLQGERSRTQARYAQWASDNTHPSSSNRQRRRSHVDESDQRRSWPAARAASTSNANFTTSVELGNQANSLIFAPATVGTPPRTFLFQIDTTSSDWWIVTDAWGPDPNDPLLQNTTYIANITTDLPTPPSSSFVSTKHDFDSTLSSGGTIYTGFQGRDIIRFASRTLSNATLNIDTHSSAGEPVLPANGVAAFGWQGLANAQAPTFWQQAGVGSFSLYLATTPSYSDSYAYGGRLYLGPPPEPAPAPSPNASSPYTGNINYYPLLPAVNQTWSINLTSITVNNSPITFSPLSKGVALIDSSTSTIGVPDSVASAFYARVPGAEQMPLNPGYYWYPCNQSRGIPSPLRSNTPLNVTFGFGTGSDDRYTIPDGLFGIPLSVPASGQTYGNDENVLIQKDEAQDPDGYAGMPDAVKCVGALYSYGNLSAGNLHNSSVINYASHTAQSDGPLIIIGLPLLRSYFTVFDGTRPAVGFAQYSDPPTSDTALARGSGTPSWLAAFKHGIPDKDNTGSPGPYDGSDTGSGNGGDGTNHHSAATHTAAHPAAAWQILSTGMSFVLAALLCQG
ncbi:hypothetical protein OC846_001268 [Tilletia horrida]|uniref:Peptidase A1 domain-containing protein n=1 Tax=Tilletia horrida TaxID=155126 RepID=A0AAN6GTM2_9BASI|nr:hypothetical protein OC846_001268 [Tilletia horrida]